MLITGIDEVGRGCWAGPLVACAVVLDDRWTMPDGATWRLDDSKKLSARQRQIAAQAIRRFARSHGIGWVEADELDQVGMTAAVRLAMRRAYEATGVLTKSTIIDGSINFLQGIPGSVAIVKADGCIPAVSAASVLAKVARDEWMYEAARRFPGYGFEHNVGYGTAVHQRGLFELGPCDIHRRSFKPVAKMC